MTITVTPETFTLVSFDAGEIVSIIERLLPDVGLDGQDVTLAVDERVPMGRAEIVSIDPIELEVEGGALEHPKLPRQLSEEGSADILGRLLLRVRDRRDPAFGDPPADADLPNGYKTAWDVYCVGRLARKGYRAQRQRRLYGFRTQHAFSDEADAAFEQLWTGENLSWADITRLSDAAAATRASAA